MSDRGSIGEPVMEGDPFSRWRSSAQHDVAPPGLSYLARAAAEIPLPMVGDSLVIGDFGCGGGRNGMAPLRHAVAGIRARTDAPVEVVHTDLPSNDFGSLFRLVETSPKSYAAGQGNVFAYAAGRSLYGPVVPNGRLSLGWSAIAVHWLSSMPGIVADGVYANLVSDADRARLHQRSAEDWDAFLRERYRELRPGGQLVVVGASSDARGNSGAEGLFTMIDAHLRDMVDEAIVRLSEYENIFYPTWNRTLDEFLAPFVSGPLGEVFEVVELGEGRVDDADSYPQFERDGDDMGFARAYIDFVRALTEPALFQWIEPDRTPAKKREIVDGFYLGLEARIIADPAAATCHWNTVSMRIIKRT